MRISSLLSLTSEYSGSKTSYDSSLYGQWKFAYKCCLRLGNSDDLRTTENGFVVLLSH